LPAPVVTAATADSNSEKTNHGFAVAVEEAQKPTATGSSDTKTNLANADANGSHNQHKKQKQQRQKHESQKPLNDEQIPNMRIVGILEQNLHEIHDEFTQFHYKYNSHSSNGAEQQRHGHRGRNSHGNG